MREEADWEALPAEIVEAVLCRVDRGKDILACRSVSKQFRNLIDSRRFWQRVYSRAKVELPHRLRTSLELATALDHRSAFGRNLVVNGDCDRQEYNMRDVARKFPYWDHVGHFHSNWVREELDSATLPPALLLATQGTTRCFSVALTYGPNEMHQKISFTRGGIEPAVIGCLRPPIEFKAWCYISPDRNSSLMILLKLMSQNEKVLSAKRILLPSVEGSEEEHGMWHHVHHTFEGYPKEAEKVLVMFLGDDMKITGTSLKLKL